MTNKTEHLIAEYADQEQLQLSCQYDDCIIGVLSDGRIVYSVFKILKILQQDMCEEDALDHFYYNFDNSKGDTMPVYMFNLEDYDE
ncbi:MAG: hypothetical protein Unbinned3556contig1001_6 [Prokaryotic dsDNA virus sp.]|nr:MAG: hypothetical protein Unbinned3556contig1001_6 [Prokaryotic dsDNA virus sp.]|tara:strand:- start:2200 stop:2457 length:258 start_codon:yes stop_codon:yes gene_type:complete